MIKDPVKKQTILQIFNSKVKGTLRHYMNFVELGPGKFFNPKADSIDNLGLEVRRGFKLTLCPISNELLMQIDVCSKINRKDNFLRELEKYNAQSANNVFKGATVITKYGKIKTYRIEEIDYTLNPASSFYSDKEAGKITYAQYYAKCYGIKTLNMKQPLIHTIRRVEKVIENGKIVEKPIYVYLIPELVSLTGMSDEDRANHNAMKEIAPYTKLEPKQRAQ